MKKHLLLIILSSLIITNCFAQATFQKTYGGQGSKKMTGLARTNDGGYVLAGGSGSLGDTIGDIYLVKTDSTGKLLWSMTYHGNVNDYCNKVIETTDHGLLLIGQTFSFGSGIENAFLTKTDSAGNIQWSKAYGGTMNDFFWNARQTYDGGYIAVGGTTSFGAGDYDMLVIRTNALGDTLWTRILGGPFNDQMEDVVQTADSNFVLCGRTNSFGWSLEESFLCKLNQSGDTLWTRVFGGDSQQEAIHLERTYDGGYIVTGSSDSFTSSFDGYLNRFDSTGNLLWSKIYSGLLTDATYNIVIMSDSGFALLGFTNSFGNPDERTEGDDSSNTWVVRTDKNGDTLWTREYGGFLQDESYGFLKTSNDGLVILGYSNSFSGSDTTDGYLIKTDASGYSGCNGRATNPIVLSPTSMVGDAPVQIVSGVFVAGAPFLQNITSTITDVLCASVGIVEEDILSEGLTLYPDPASNQLNINIPSLHQNETVYISITNVLGQVLYQSTITNPEFESDISFLSQGLYFVELESKQQRWIGRFIKE